ncbi:MAG: ribosome biogenesis GTPase Der [Clostridia bacterium]|nr:ribosome biogenesis GTPase Der [Oscillospiraceae bacterium]MBQ7032619.1 ribosome biogenesis GTPase Der [Clostridia bacterium]
MTKPILAVIGRPNVGKSTLFNKIIGQRLSIVEDTPGITRDRIYSDAEWFGRAFSVVDTGGIEPAGKDVILQEMRLQVQLAMDTADVILFITNLKEGVTANDMEIATMLQKSGKPTLLVVNKCDAPGEVPVGVYEFYSLGIGDPYPVSSLHGMGLGDVIEKAISLFPEEAAEEADNDSIKVAIVGKPNAGKSSLVNHILGENRMIVSNIPGTTRDAIDSLVERDGQHFTLIDTAGMRRHSRVDDTVERYSVMRALTAVERCDVAVIVIDASAGISEQDAKIAGYVHEAGKASIILVNKWDLIEKETKTMQVFQNSVYDTLSFMTYAPNLFISAKTGQRVDKLFPLIQSVYQQNSMRISTGVLNDILTDATEKVQPPSDKGKRLKIYYMTQASTNPPTFILFVNDKELAHFSYIRYLENRIRETFGLTGTPLRFIVRERNENRN